MSIVRTTIFALSALLMVATTAAAVGAGQAGDFLAGFGDRAIEQLADEKASKAEREARFRTLLEEGFDVPLIAQFVLGRYWRSASEAERQAFIDVFKDYLVQRFLPLFDGVEETAIVVGQVRRDPSNESVSWVGLTIQQNGVYRTDWRLLERDGNFKILDVKAEGTSMALTLRDEYGAVIRDEGGVEGLVKRMRRLLAEGAFKPKS